VKHTILALDMSLTACGATCARTDWDGRRELVRFREPFGYELPKTATPRERTLRMVGIARDIRMLAVYYKATEVWAEGLPHRGFNLQSLAELRGIVRAELELECGLALQLVPPAKARRLLYGRQPPQGLSDTQRKAWLLEPLKLAGFPFVHDAQSDAFCVLNHAMAEHGAFHLQELCGPPPVPSKARKRPRKRASVQRLMFEREKAERKRNPSKTSNGSGRVVAG